MDPFEPLKYEEPLMALKARIAKEGSKAVFSPLIEKFILNNPHLVTVEMQVCNFTEAIMLQCLTCQIVTSIIYFSLIQRKIPVMKLLRKKS